MLNLEWKMKLDGYYASILEDKYLLEVWKTDSSYGRYYASVNTQMIVDENGNDELFDSAEWAKAAAESLAEEILHKDGIIDSAGN